MLRYLAPLSLFACLPSPLPVALTPPRWASEAPHSQPAAASPQGPPLVSSWTPASALTGWHWDAPSPQGNNLNDLWSSGPSLYLVGDAGTLLRSDDNGDSWALTRFEHEVDLSSLWSSRPEELYLMGQRASDSVLYHSVDGGLSWAQTAFSERLEWVFGLSAEEVYLGGAPGVLWRSIDGGQTWRDLKANSPDSFVGVWGDPARSFVVSGSEHTARFSAGASNTWRGAPPRDLRENLHSLCGDGAGGLFLVGNGATILRSNDWGESWTRQESANEESLYGVWCGAKGEAIAVGARGTMISTLDAGESWREHASEHPYSDLYTIKGTPSGDLFVIGEGGLTLRSLDRGASWQKLSGEAPYLLSIWGSSAEDIYAVGWNGVVLHGGKRDHWVRLRPETEDLQLISVWGSGPMDVYLLSTYGDLFHSTDGGDTWARTRVSSEHRTSRIWGTGPGDVYILGDDGLILHSSDRGHTWRKRESGTDYSLKAIWGRDPKSLSIVGEQGIILRSRDAGRTWSKQLLWPPEEGVWAKSLEGLVGNSAGELFAVGYCGCLVYSSDAGKTWTVKETSRTSAMMGLWLDGDEILSASEGGQVLRVNRARDDWELVQTPASASLRALWSSKDSGLYAVGQGGAIVHRK